MANASILAIDDEADILALISFSLSREGYTVIPQSSAEAGLSTILTRQESPDLIVLDLMLPGMDGLSLCRKLKSQESTKHIPIIMLTARTEDSDVVSGLEVGADDYITKPFSPRVLVARVRALLRKQDEIRSVRSGVEESTPLSDRLSVGKISIDIPRHEVLCNGKQVQLSATEFAILEFLARNEGLVFSRTRIIDGIRGKDYPVTERSVDVQILGLRKKLGPEGDQIETVRGVGYRLATHAPA